MTIRLKEIGKELDSLKMKPPEVPPADQGNEDDNNEQNGEDDVNDDYVEKYLIFKVMYIYLQFIHVN